jgi:TolA-binding protein
MAANPSRQPQTAAAAAQRLSGPAPLRWVRGALAWCLRPWWHAAIVVGAGVLLLLGGWWLSATPQAAFDFDAALAALQAGDLQAARPLASPDIQPDQLEPEARGPLALVRGLLARHAAHEHYGAARRQQIESAAAHLNEALQRGIPDAWKATAAYHLADSLLELGRAAEALQALNSPELEPSAHAPDAWLLQARAYAALPAPRLDRSLEASARFLDAVTGDDPRRTEALVHRADVLLRAARLDECRQTLEQLPPSARTDAAVELLHGRLLLEDARRLRGDAPQTARAANEVAAAYAAAIAALRRAAGEDFPGSRTLPEAVYLLGVALEESGDPAAARQRYERLGSLWPDAPATLAALVQQAELHLRLGQMADAGRTWLRVLQQVAGRPGYGHALLPAEELRRRAVESYRRLLQGHAYSEAVRLAEQLHVVMPLAESLPLQAEAAEAWGAALLQRAADDPSQAESLRREARRQFHAAAQAYSRLAQQTRTQRSYPDYLRQAGQQFARAQDYPRAVQFLRAYLRFAPPRLRDPAALVALAEAYLAAGDATSALQQLREVIEFYPRHPAVYAARLLAAQAHARQGDYESAEQRLRENLEGAELEPSSIEWRDSLFALGDLHFQLQQWPQAVQKLSEAVMRYPQADASLPARYQLAEAHRHLAAARAQMQATRRVPAAQDIDQQAIREHLRAALDAAQAARVELHRRGQQRALTPLEEAIGRYCDFARGELLWQLGDYPAAAKVLADLVRRYDHTPQVLDAYVQLAAVYRALQRADQARVVAAQAQLALAQLPEDASLEATTQRSRQAWEQYLQWLRSW